MGIINLTPDSFYGESRLLDDGALVDRVGNMLREGATFIDLGGYSTRPGAEEVSLESELERIVPRVALLTRTFPEILISVDTFRAKVAAQCIDAGAALVNDVSGGSLDPDMLLTVARHMVPYIGMHMKGDPRTMQGLTQYDDLLPEVLRHLSAMVGKAVATGVNDVIIDPGFGFAKTVSQNFELLRNLDLFHTLRRPILVGISRKSMVYRALGTTAGDALNGTTALHMYALEKGANILRVHDVGPTIQCIALYERLLD